ncbi:MAG: hypothetical protein OEZ39_17305 [Gammaproteobacteria bacterium]|nr:hypothetical protein [Gammaproteobacteria bacterium]MDH5653621.1 hypothetical protein [Gammaproteobacteria bacterium]
MKKIISGILLFMVFTLSVSAEEDSRTLRSNTHIGIDVGYAPVSLPFPSTKSLSAYLILDPNWQIGFEYAWTTFGLKALSFELGAMEEDNYTIKARYFPNSNSFNWVFGYGRRDMTVKLASDFFDLVTNTYSMVASQTRTNYVQLGLSNQWQWQKGYVVTVDWLTVNIPVAAEVTTSASQYAKDATYRARIQDAEDILAWYPQAWVVEMKVGFAF